MSRKRHSLPRNWAHHEPAISDAQRSREFHAFACGALSGVALSVILLTILSII